MTFDECRKSVKRFALLMEQKLREHEHKGGWENESFEWLFSRLLLEAGELEGAVEYGGSAQDIAREAADVANFAMMIASNARSYEDQEDKGE